MTDPDPESHVQAATAAAERQDWAAAAEAWQEVARLAPRHPGCFDKAAVALRRLGRFDASDAIIGQAIATLGARPEHHVILGDTAMDRRKWRAALAHWDALRRMAPRMAKGWFRAAQAHMALKEYDQAEAVCAAGLRVLPKEQRLLRVKAEIARRLGTADPSSALPPSPAARELLDGGPGRPDAGTVSLYLDELQRQGSAVKLQRRIIEARKAWESGLPLPEHSGLMRHFAKAGSDPRLAAILAGETRRRPPGARIRVVFYFPHVTQTDHLMPLYERMQADPRFDPVILAGRSRGRAEADAFGFYAAKYPASEGGRVIDGGFDVNASPSFYELGADLVFFHTPYSLNAARPFYLRADFAARHCRVAHVTYGYPLLSLDTKSHHVYAGGHVKQCDMIFAESPVCVEPYGRHLDPRRIHVTGYTKTDEFRRHLDPAPFEALAAGAVRLDVMWTPHWQVKGDSKGDTETSNFLRYHETMLRLAQRPDIRLHVRPHPLLRLRLNSLGILRFAEYDRIMDAFRAGGAEVHPAEEGVSYIPALMKAMVLVSDFSSLVAEYTITNRPIIFCRTEEVWQNGRWIGDFGKRLIESCCHTVDDAAGLEAALDRILTTRRHPGARRMADFVEGNALFPEGSASTRICDVIAAGFAAWGSGGRPGAGGM
jgi:tetratricopeptide (TPR) repeat protein